MRPGMMRSRPRRQLAPAPVPPARAAQQHGQPATLTCSSRRLRRNATSDEPGQAGLPGR